MRRPIRIGPLLVGLLLSIAVAVEPIGPRAAEAEPATKKRLVVIVGRDSPVTDLSRIELNRMFTGSVVYVAKLRLVPFNFPPASRERTSFDGTMLGMSPAEVGRFWMDRKIRGQSGAPRSLPAAYVVKLVARLPGAIGYVAEDQLTPAVRAIRVGGLAYTDATYPLFLQ
ncbi:MAG TPA: hypothetical protein VK698_17100 [Kofleriaceae bacterium]|nr:hypothetical protein [Kofleriaceae bacterium]